MRPGGGGIRPVGGERGSGVRDISRDMPGAGAASGRTAAGAGRTGRGLSRLSASRGEISERFRI
jgi:hypothetical protein